MTGKQSGSSRCLLTRFVLCAVVGAESSWSNGCYGLAARIVIVSPERYLLDTSALLTLIEDEAGADRVEYVLTHEQVLLPWPVLLEAYYITQQERGQAEADRRYALIKQLPATILWDVDEPTLLTAARLKATYRVSLADALIAAFAAQHDAVLVHKDPEFEAVAGQVMLEPLPYKSG
jgi:predicted nucleic acid-binding protein